MKKKEYYEYIGGKLRNPLLWIGYALAIPGGLILLLTKGTPRIIGSVMVISGILALAFVTAIANVRYWRSKRQ